MGGGGEAALAPPIPWSRSCLGPKTSLLKSMNPFRNPFHWWPGSRAPFCQPREEDTQASTLGSPTPRPPTQDAEVPTPRQPTRKQEKQEQHEKHSKTHETVIGRPPPPQGKTGWRTRRVLGWVMAKELGWLSVLHDGKWGVGTSCSLRLAHPLDPIRSY